jgi:hypothetical protein
MAVGSSDAERHYVAVQLTHVAQTLNPDNAASNNFASLIQRLFDKRPARIIKLNEHHITVNPTKCKVCSAIRDGGGVKWRWVA